MEIGYDRRNAASEDARLRRQTQRMRIEKDLGRWDDARHGYGADEAMQELYDNEPPFRTKTEKIYNIERLHYMERNSKD